MFKRPHAGFLVLMAVLCCQAAPSAWAQKVSQADVPRDLNLPAGTLSQALDKLGDQSGIQIIYEASLAEGIKVASLSGTLSVRAALAQLLANTGLKADTPNDKTVVLKRANSSTSNALPADQMRVADASGTPSSPATAAEEPETNSKGTPEILVRGSRTLNADIQRTKDDIQPYVVYTADEIQRSMATNLEDFFRSRLTMASVPTNQYGEPTGSFSQDPYNGSNQSQINLRGLGVDETLILVNGRRRPGVSYINTTAPTGTGDFGQPDLNGIPLSSIARIEVLPATAGGIYGGGATGGVINIILKTDYSGTEVAANYSNTFDGESGLKRLTANGGFTLEGGKSSINFTASYSEQNPMFMRDRGFFLSDMRARIISSDPHAFENRSLQLPVGYTPNIRAIQICTYPPPAYIPVCSPSSLPTTLRLKPQFGGTSLGSIVTHVPAGYAGDLQQLVANAGTVDLGLANDLGNAGRSIINNPRTSSFNLTFNREFTGWLSMYANLMRSMNHGSSRSAGIYNTGYRIAANAPTNPFDSPIEVTIPFPGFSYGKSNDSEALDGVLGATIDLPFQWRAQLEGSWGRSRSESFGGDPFVFYDQRDSNFNVVREGIVNAVARGAIDVLLDTNQQPIDLSDYTLDPYPNRTQTPSDSVSTGGVLRLSGPVARIPGGAVMLSGMLEHRENKAEEVVATFIDTRGENTYQFYPDRSVDTDSYYVEASIPVISARNALAWVRGLDLQASIRRDESSSRSVRTTAYPINGPDDRPASVEYTDSSVVGTGYTFGFRLTPVPDITLRSSFSRGFLPPSIGQLSPKIGRTDVTDPNDPRYMSSGLYDPLRGYTRAGSDGFPVTIISEGNPDLNPEKSRSISAGMILEPRFAPGMRVSIDYTQIEKKDEIAQVNYSEILGMTPELADRIYPGRLVRAPRTSGDPYAVGPITFFDYSLTNNLDSTVKAVDFQVNYSLGTSGSGRFEFYGVATLAKEMSRRPTVQSPLTDLIGFHEGPLKWRGNAGIDWTRGALSLGWNMQYLDKQKIYDSGDFPVSIDYYADQQGSAIVPNQTYHDLSFRYEPGRGRFSSIRMLEGVRISGGVQNVLDTHPPIDIRNTELGFSLYGDPRLRRYTLDIVKSF